MKKYTAVLIVLGLLTSCAGLTHRRNEAQLAKVSKVAVVGFDVREPVVPGARTDAYQARIEEMMTTFRKLFGQQTSWQVTPLDRMKKNAAYAAAYDRTMNGWQNKNPPGERERKLTPDGIMDNDGLRILGKDGRTALMKALKVDALVTAEVDVFLSGTTVMGIGNRYPQTRVSLALYRPDADVSDWFEGNIQGDPAKTSVGKTAFIDGTLMNQLAVESARTAFNRISRN